MPLSSGRDLERLQLTIGFIAARFKALASIIAIYVFTDILSKAVLSVLPRNYFTGIVKSIVTPYRIVIVPLKDLLLQQYILQHLDLIILSQESLIVKGIVLITGRNSPLGLLVAYRAYKGVPILYSTLLEVVDLGRSVIKLNK